MILILDGGNGSKRKTVTVINTGITNQLPASCKAPLKAYHNVTAGTLGGDR